MTHRNRYRELQSGATGFVTGHIGAINALDIEQQYSRYLLSAGADSSIKIWDLGEKRLPQPQYENEEEDDDEDYDSDNDNNASISSNDETSPTADVNPQTSVSRKRASLASKPGSPESSLPPKSKKRRVTSSPALSSASKPKPFRYSLVAQVARKTHHRFGVSAIQWYPGDAGLFVSASFDHTVKAWDTETLDPVYSFDLEHRVYSAHVAPDPAAHALIATATESPLLRLLDLRSAAAAHTLKGHGTGGLRSIRWAPTHAHLLASGGADGTVRLWDIRQSKACLDILDVYRTQPNRNSSPKEVSMPNATKGSVNNKNNNKNNAAATPANLSTKIFSHQGTVNSLLWLPNSENLLSAGTDDEIRLWAIPDYSKMREKSQRPAPRAYNTLLNYGRLVSNRFPQTLYMCLSYSDDDGGGGKCHDQPCNIEDAQDSNVLFFPSDSGQILVYDVHSGQLLNRLDRRTREGVYATDIPRTTCIAPRGNATSPSASLNCSLEYYSGALDGTITRWVVSPPESKHLQHSQDSLLLQESKKNVCINNEASNLHGGASDDNKPSGPALHDTASITVTTATSDVKNKDSDESDSDNDYEWAGNVLASLK